MIKDTNNMTREELIETVLDLRHTLLDVHIRFLRGLVMELESGELKLTDIDPYLVEKLRKALKLQ